MKRVAKEIFDYIEDNDSISMSATAKLLKITVKQLNNYKDGTRELTFSSLVKLAQIIYPTESHARISQWCLDFTTTDTISNAFAYATVKRDTELLAKLVEKHDEADAKIAQCARVYKFILRYIKRDVSKFNMLEEICDLKYIKNSSLILLLDIYRLIAVFHKQDFQIIPTQAADLLRRIKELNDKKLGFLKECYLHLVAEVLALTNLHFNNLEKARHYAQMIINAKANYRSLANAYYVLSMTFLGEDETKCIYYMTESYENSRLSGDINVERDGLYNLHYVQLLLGKDLPTNAEPALVYFEKFRKGQVSKAEAEEVIRECEDLDLISLFECISGGMSGSIVGYHTYISEGNLFNATVILREIIRAGENSDFVCGLAKLCFNKNPKDRGDDLFEETYIRSFSNGYCGGISSCA